MAAKWLLLMILVSMVWLSGCSEIPNIADMNRRLTSIDMVRKKGPDAEYVVDPPDVIMIEFLEPQVPDGTRTVAVRSDGRVTLPHVEDVKVGGQTPLQIREQLEKLYSRYYRNPRILVTVTSYNSKHVYVYGEVGRQGSIPYTGSQTVMDVMGQVGGFNHRAAPSRVRVIRRDPENPETYRVDLNKLLYEGDISQDVSLAEDDVIYVPPWWGAQIGYWIDDILFPFQPIFRTAGTAAQGQALIERPPLLKSQYNNED